MSLYIHTIKPAAGSKRHKKVVGRGGASGHGTSAGRGGKGQTARSGVHGLRMKAFKRMMQSTPKLGGFKSLNDRPAEVRLFDLEKSYKDGETVSLPSLIEKGIIDVNARSAKVIVRGELTKKVILNGILCTKGAKEKIVSLGGEVK